MMHWHPKNEAGFTWQHSGKLSVKGYLFDADDNYLTGPALAAYFKTADAEEFKARLLQANGLFAVVFCDGNKAWAATDRLRSFPLFYRHIDNDLHISDDAHFLANLPGGTLCLDDLRQSEFLSTGYVTGPNTLLHGLSQVQTGALLVAEEGNINQTFYHHYQTAEVRSGSYEELCRQFEQHLELVQNRFIQSLQGRPLALSLSGGYDSRLIAAMLKRANYQNVTCFTFGRANNPEMPYAKKICEQLNIPWKPIIYTP